MKRNKGKSGRSDMQVRHIEKEKIKINAVHTLILDADVLTRTMQQGIYLAWPVTLSDGKQEESRSAPVLVKAGNKD